MDAERRWRTELTSVLALSVGVGFPLGFVATYPGEGEGGFEGIIEISVVILSAPVSAWMVFLAITLLMERRWARWPAAFSFYMIAGLAARHLVVGAPRDSQFLLFIAVLLAASGVALGLLLLPSIEREFRSEDASRF